MPDAREAQLTVSLVLNSSTEASHVSCRDDVRGDAEQMLGHDGLV